MTPGETVTVTITLPSNVPVGTQYWKYGPTPDNPTDHWYPIPIGSDDGDNRITITITDGGIGDHDLTANGEIVDPGGLGTPGTPPPLPVPEFSPTGLFALIAVLSVVLVMTTICRGKR
ncbi:MAG TPA: hypothetical protein C5S37_04680 [Methanophagales archaeon]|nr:hypothetical protein [Methanophagales archaeon]